MKQDLTNLSQDELSKIIESAQRALAEKQKAERKVVIARIHALADSIGVTVTLETRTSGLCPPTRKGRKVEAKYKNPENPSETWAGRGAKPRWLKALVDAGKKIEEFLI